MPKTIPPQSMSLQTFLDPDFCIALGRDYDDVYWFKQLGNRWYGVNHPDGIRHVLQKNARNYTKGTPTYRSLKLTLRNGLLTSEGDEWLRNRRTMQPFFNRKSISRLLPVIVRCVQEKIEQWHAAAKDNTPLNAHQEMTRLALSIAGMTLFHVDPDRERTDIRRCLETGNRWFRTFADHPYRSFLFLSIPAMIDLYRSNRTLRQIVHKIINDRRAQSDPPDDLLSDLLNARDDETGKGMSDRQLCDEVLTLLLAGHETTANLLSWTLARLCHHREVLDKVVAECRANAADPTAGPEAVQHLTYTRQVLEEILRMYPPAYIVSRRAQAADEICGIDIPRNANVAVSPLVMHWHPDHWDAPEHFDPDRFHPDRRKSLNPFVYFPFGGGPRQCIGEAFAMMESVLVIAMIIRAFDIHAVTEAVPKMYLDLNLRMASPFLFRCTEAG